MKKSGEIAVEGHRGSDHDRVGMKLYEVILVLNIQRCVAHA